jgi:competence protein ComEA
MDPGGDAIQSGAPPRLPVLSRGEPPHTWPASVQIAVVLLVTACLFFVLGRWSLGSNHRDEPEVAGPALDLNRATRAELRLVPGLGDALSQRVVEHRQRAGHFRSVDDLRQIPGIGPKTLERVRPHVFVIDVAYPVSLDEDDIVAAPPMKATALPRVVAPSRKELLLTGPINVNRADLAELQKLPGVGPKISQRILDERAKARFKSIDDLRRVPGIGPKTLEKLRPYVTID